MATGYDNREPTRASFAFKPAAARLSSSVPGGTAASVRGGAAGQRASQQGSIQSQNPSINAGIGTQLPGFLEKVFEPVIQAASVERMYQGVAAALDGKTMEQIGEDQPFLAGLFGQTDFEKGASFQHTQTSVSNWQAEQLARMDELKRLDPKDVGKVLFDAAQNHMTGDRNTDNAIHRMVLEQSATLIPAVTTARIEWRRETLRNGQLEVTSAAGRNVGMLYDQFSARQLGEGQVRPSQEAIDLAEQQALQSFIMPANMPQEDWNSVVEQSARVFVAEGNIRMLNLMSRGGEDSLLFQALGKTGDGAAYQTIMGQIETLGNKTLSKVAMEYIPEIADLRANAIARTIAPGAYFRRAAEINALIAERTGVEAPYFDAEDILNGEDGVVRAIVANNDRARDRAQTLADQAATAAAAQAAKDELDRTNQREAGELFAVGDINAAKAAGASDENLNLAAYAAYQSGNVAALVNAAAKSGTTGIFSNVQQSMQAPLAAVTAGVTPDFQRSYTTWYNMYNAGTSGPEVAARYYGNYHSGLMRYHNLVRGGRTPEDAHRQAFVAEGGRGTNRTPVPRNLAPAVTATAHSTLGRNQIGSFLGMSPRIHPGSQRVVERAIGQEAARIMASSDVSEEEAARQAAGVVQGNGTLEVYGGRAWSNVPGTGRDVPFSAYTPGLTPDVIGRNLDTVLERRLNAQGISTRRGGGTFQVDVPWAVDLNRNLDYTITRLPDENGAARLWVSGTDTGSNKTISLVISSNEIMAESRAEADASVQRRLSNANGPAFSRWELGGNGSMARGSGTRQEQRRIFDADVAAGVSNPSGLPTGHPSLPRGHPRAR